MTYDIKYCISYLAFETNNKIIRIGTTDAETMIDLYTFSQTTNTEIQQSFENITVYGDCFGNSGGYKESVCYNTTFDGKGVWLNASGNITISSGSVLDGVELGFPEGVGPGFSNSLGVSYGGRGGAAGKGVYISENFEEYSFCDSKFDLRKLI